MAYGSIVIEIMVASPTDVKLERDAIVEVIQQWNYTNSRHRNFVLIPRLWETSSAPLTVFRGQEVIIKQVLENCDILVAIFWKTIGSPTGAFPSGTIEEIKTHIDKGKPGMIYFSLADIPQDHDRAQLQEVNKFKEECQKDDSLFRSLYSEYKTILEFKENFREHLDIMLHSNDYLQSEVTNAMTNFFSENVNFSFPTSEENAAEIELSDTAKSILTEACQDQEGRIYQQEFVGGLLVQTNGKQFDAMNDGRKEAIIKKAISQLERESFIESEGYESKLFRVTTEGYDYYDKFLKKE